MTYQENENSFYHVESRKWDINTFLERHRSHVEITFYFPSRKYIETENIEAENVASTFSASGDLVWFSHKFF